MADAAHVPPPTADAREYTVDEAYDRLISLLVAAPGDESDSEWHTRVEGIFQDFPAERPNLSKQCYQIFRFIKQEAEVELKMLQYIRAGLNSLAATTKRALKDEERRLQSEITRAKIVRDKKNDDKNSKKFAMGVEIAMKDALDKKFLKKSRFNDYYAALKKQKHQ